MVLVDRVQSRPAARRVRIDPARVAAGTGAIAVHGGLLLLLLVPVTLPQALQFVREVPPFQVVEIVPPREIAPARPARDLPTLPVEVTLDPVTRTDAPTPVARAPVIPATGTPQVVDAGPTHTVPAGTGAVGPVATPVDTTPLAGARLAYAEAPPPPYPVDALREGRSGTVLLQVLVGIDGRPERVTVSRSSGHRDLDRIAARHVERSWRFQPALRDGVPVQAIGLVPIEFRTE